MQQETLLEDGSAMIFMCYNTCYNLILRGYDSACECLIVGLIANFVNVFVRRLQTCFYFSHVLLF